jgi:hypothetical protein
MMTASEPKPESTGGELRHQFQIGKEVYRRWQYPGREDYWYEAHRVEKVTKKQVHVWVRGTGTVVLSRTALEYHGNAIARAHGMVFYVDMPEDYRKKTIGYLMEKGPREVLGLPEFFTKDQLSAAYHQKSLETHPDRGGSAEAFQAVQEAYDHLKDGWFKE